MVTKTSKRLLALDQIFPEILTNKTGRYEILRKVGWIFKISFGVYITVQTYEIDRFCLHQL